MQNPSVANTLPAVQTPVSSVQGSAADQPAETFGSVLARQQTAAEEPADNGQATPARAARATGDSEISGSIPKDAQGITDEMLAALLPDADSILRAAGVADNTPLAAGTGDTPPAGAITVQLPASATALPYTASFAQTASCTTGDMPPTPLLLRARDDGAAPSGARPAGALPSMTTQPAQETAGFDTLLPAQLSSARVSAPPVQPDATAITFLNTPQQYGADPTAPGLVGAVQLRLNTPLANRSWGEDLGQKVVWMVAQGTQTAELHLNPPLLGPLDVVLNVSGDQATALFASPHATVRLAVEQALPKLREMLADNGITLGNATVGDQLPDNRQGGPENGQQSRGFRPDSAGGALLTGASQNGVTVLPGRRHEGMVDIFA